LEAVTRGLLASAAFLEDRRALAQQRQAVIAANADLQERELLKLAGLAAAMAEALRDRGIAEPSASLAAEAGMAVFRVAFERWLDDPKARKLAQHVRLAIRELRAVTAAP